MTRTSKAWIWAVLAASLATGSAGYAESWWNPRWPIRRVVDVEAVEEADRRSTVRTDRRGCWITMPTGGECKPDGSDIRVTGIDGKPVKFAILSMGPGDLLRLVFEVRGPNKQRYFVYYGNTHAEAEKRDDAWRPEAGLLLETWPVMGSVGRVNTAELIRDAVLAAKDRPPVGRMYIPSISIPQDVFDAKQITLNRYTGFLRCAQSGTYRFSISSGDGSALFIDDKPVVAWPGWHGWVADVRHQGKVELQAGVHRFAIYHVSCGRRGGMVAAWMTPSTNTWRVLDEGYFAPIGRGVLGPLEKRRKELTADFTCRQAGFAAAEGVPESSAIYRYEFMVLNPDPRREVEYRWDFGDGQRASGTSVTHVFFGEGIRAIGLEVKRGGQTDRTVNRVEIGPNRMNWRETASPLREFEAIFSTYQFHRMPAKDLMAAKECFEVLDRPEKVLQLCREGVGAWPRLKKDAPAGLLQRLAGDAAAVLVDKHGDYAGAAEIFVRAAKEAQPQTLEYRELTAQAAQLCVNALGQDARAEELLKSCAGQSTQPGNTISRSLAIAWGDVFRFRGQRKSAEQFYRQAESADRQEKRFATAGAYVTAVEDYLRRSEFGEARKLLDRWQWDYPMERVAGYSNLLRYRLYLARHQTEPAKRLAEIMKRVDPYGVYTRRMGEEKN